MTKKKRHENLWIFYLLLFLAGESKLIANFVQFLPFKSSFSSLFLPPL